MLHSPADRRRIIFATLSTRVVHAQRIADIFDRCPRCHRSKRDDLVYGFPGRKPVTWLDRCRGLGMQKSISISGMEMRSIEKTPKKHLILEGSTSVIRITYAASEPAAEPPGPTGTPLSRAYLMKSQTISNSRKSHFPMIAISSSSLARYSRE